MPVPISQWSLRLAVACLASGKPRKIIISSSAMMILVLSRRMQIKLLKIKLVDRSKYFNDANTWTHINTNSHVDINDKPFSVPPSAISGRRRHDSMTVPTAVELHRGIDEGL